MRTLLATAVALLTASAAHAQTINLQPTGNDSGKRLYVEVHRASGWEPIDIASSNGTFYGLNQTARAVAQVWAYRANGSIEGPQFGANGTSANSVIYGNQAQVINNGSGSTGDGFLSVSVSANGYLPTGKNCTLGRQYRLHVGFIPADNEPSTLTVNTTGCQWQPAARPFDDIRLAYGIPPAPGSTPTMASATATIAPTNTLAAPTTKPTMTPAIQTCNLCGVQLQAVCP